MIKIFKKILSFFIKDKKVELPSQIDFDDPNKMLVEIFADGSISYFIGIDARGDVQKQIYESGTKEGRKFALIDKLDQDYKAYQNALRIREDKIEFDLAVAKNIAKVILKNKDQEIEACDSIQKLVKLK